MRISLIGMSGSGKTYWARQFESKGFNCFYCDDLIEEKLGDELKRLGYAGIRDVAKWMGHPFDPQYSKTSKKYLYFEKEVMNEILITMERPQYYDHNVVIDTTGSIVYIGEDILKKLSNVSHVVYLETPISVMKEMYKSYLEDPKPVIWGNSFCKKYRESNFEALAKCYPNLLSDRSKRYEMITDITLDYRMLRSPDFTIDKFMEMIRT